MGKIVYLPDRAAHPAPDCGPGRAQNRQRILLAYPGWSKREYLAVFLASRGYDVIACSNGREALAHLAADPFELVVTAILMPHIDGLELVRSLRRRGGPPVMTVADGMGKMDRIYLRSAILHGAAAAHSFCEAAGALLDSVDWILRGGDDAIKDVVW